MLNFCTLFDANYLHFGVALYRSLEQHCPSFHLYIFAFDDVCYEKLTQAKLSNATIISLAEFEDEELLRVKPTRSKGEYCWTCTPSTIRYCLNTYNLDHCTYLDSDIYFYSNPAPLIDELKELDVSIIPHRYHKNFMHFALTSGTYCVQFMTFKNTPKGKEVLTWWRDACIAWCYARFEDGKFGDQLYLEDWLKRFDGAVHVLQNKGAGVAPWNFADYHYTQNKLMYNENQEETPLIFFHFHQLKSCEDSFYLSYYEPSADFYTNVYFPYIQLLQSIRKEFKMLDHIPSLLSPFAYKLLSKLSVFSPPKIFLNASPFFIALYILSKNIKDCVWIVARKIKQVLFPTVRIK